jgi:hypothetical protein
MYKNNKNYTLNEKLIKKYQNYGFTISYRELL